MWKILRLQSTCPMPVQKKEHKTKGEQFSSSFLRCWLLVIFPLITQAPRRGVARSGARRGRPLVVMPLAFPSLARQAPSLYLPSPFPTRSGTCHKPRGHWDLVAFSFCTNNDNNINLGRGRESIIIIVVVGRAPCCRGDHVYEIKYKRRENDTKRMK